MLFTTAFGVSQISFLPNRPWEYGPGQITPYQNGIVFDATNPTTRRQAIWTSDGTRHGTHPLNLHQPGDKQLVGVVGDQVYYAVMSTRLVANSVAASADSTSPTSELFVTNNLGRTSNDLGPLPTGAGSGTSLAMGGDLYFATVDEIGTSRFWITDGTKAGTHELTGLANTQIAGPVNLIQFNNEILIEQDLGVGDLAVFDPATQDEQLLSRNATSPVVFDNRIYFTASDFNATDEDPALWSSDGTIQSTVDLYTGAANRSSLPAAGDLAVTAGNHLLIWSYAGLTGDSTSIFVCDGTVASIQQIADLSSEPPATVFAGSAVFSVLGPIRGGISDPIWISDGTIAGTREVLTNTNHYDPFLVASGPILFGATDDHWHFDFLAHATHTGPGQLFVYARTASPAPVMTVTINNSTLTSSSANSAVNASVTIQISNSGDAFSNGKYVLELDLSADGVTTSARLAKRVIHLAIKPGESQMVTLPIHRIPRIASGNYHVIAKLLGAQDVYADASMAVTVAISPAA